MGPNTLWGVDPSKPRMLNFLSVMGPKPWKAWTHQQGKCFSCVAGVPRQQARWPAIWQVHSQLCKKRAIVYADCRKTPIVYLLNRHDSTIIPFLYGFLSVFSENGSNADIFYRNCRTQSDISCSRRTQTDFFMQLQECLCFLHF